MKRKKDKASRIFLILVNEKVYQATRPYVDNVIKQGKDEMTKRQVNAIVALERDGMITLMKDEYITRDQLYTATLGYIKDGYKVYNVMAGKFC